MLSIEFQVWLKCVYHILHGILQSATIWSSPWFNFYGIPRYSVLVPFLGDQDGNRNRKKIKTSMLFRDFRCILTGTQKCELNFARKFAISLKPILSVLHFLRCCIGCPFFHKQDALCKWSNIKTSLLFCAFHWILGVTWKCEPKLTRIIAFSHKLILAVLQLLRCCIGCPFLSEQDALCKRSNMKTSVLFRAFCWILTVTQMCEPHFTGRFKISRILILTAVV